MAKKYNAWPQIKTKKISDNYVQQNILFHAKYVNINVTSLLTFFPLVRVLIIGKPLIYPQFARLNSVINWRIGCMPNCLAVAVKTRAFKESLTLQDSNAFVKLLKLNLKQCNGGPRYWVSFINLFITAVETNTDLSDVKRYRYLLIRLSVGPREPYTYTQHQCSQLCRRLYSFT